MEFRRRGERAEFLDFIEVFSRSESRLVPIRLSQFGTLIATLQRPAYAVAGHGGQGMSERHTALPSNLSLLVINR
jgi:hypothetical protein